jgi:Alginate export
VFSFRARLALTGLLTAVYAFGQADSAPQTPLFTDRLNSLLPKWISFSGEERMRLEGSSAVGFKPDNSDFYLLQRFRWGMTLRLKPWLKIVSQTQDARVFFQNGVAAVPYQDTWDLRQAYAEIGDADKSPIALRVGRQEIRLGGERMVGVSNWTNTSRSFDAARLILRHGKFRLDTIASTVVVLRDGQVGSADAGNNLHGFYGVVTDLIPHSTLEPYLLWRLQPHVAAESGGSGTVSAKLSGVRWVGKVNATDYAVGLVFEHGSLVKDNVNAWASHWLVGYTFQSAWTPRIFSEFNYATGDGNPKDGQRNTFDQLYATNHDRYGLADEAGWRNIEHIRVGVDTRPGPGWSASLRYNWYWLADAHDALYNTRGDVVAKMANGAAGRWVGSEIDVLGKHTVGKSSEIGAGFAHIFPGTFLKLATPGRSYNAPYLYLSSRL